MLRLISIHIFGFHSYDIEKDDVLKEGENLMAEILLAVGIALGMMLSTFILMNYEKLLRQNIELLLGSSYNFSAKYSLFLQGSVEDEQLEIWEESYSRVFTRQNREEQRNVTLREIDRTEQLTRGGVTDID